MRHSVEPTWLTQLAETEFLATLLGSSSLDPAAPAVFLAKLSSREQACASDLLADTSRLGGLDDARRVLHHLKVRLLTQQLDQAQARARGGALLTPEVIELSRQLHGMRALAMAPRTLTPF
jgi:hypothetical protein